MYRREFAIGTGAIMTAAVFAHACGRAKPELRPLTARDPADPPIIDALRYGITAPSAHNTQPWRIELLSNTEARLFMDPERLLPVTDPPGRQGHISHGTLLEVTAIAATQLGYSAEIVPFPDGEMSYQEFGMKPTARIRLVETKGHAVDPLAAEVLTRRSSRLPHDGPMVTQQELSRLVELAQPGSVKMGLIPDALRPEVIEIARRAMKIEVDDYELYDETRFWFRFSRREIERHRDGLSVNTAGLTGFSAGAAKLFLSSRNWHKEKNGARYLDTFGKTLESTRGLLTMTTPTNTTLDWLHTGRVYARAQLAASTLGLRFHPLSQVLQEYSQMDELRAQFDALSTVKPPAKIQMLLRVGRTATPGLSPRRSLDDLLV